MMMMMMMVMQVMTKDERTKMVMRTAVADATPASIMPIQFLLLVVVVVSGWHRAKWPVLDSDSLLSSFCTLVCGGF